MQQNEEIQEEIENKVKTLEDPTHSGAMPNPWYQSMASTIDEKALRMMQKMGYKLGSGLGKDEQGITNSIEVNANLGKRGLGLELNSLNLSDEQWDFAQEDIVVTEKVQWLESPNKAVLIEEDWMKEGPPNEDIVGNATFCDENVLQNVFKAKDIFDELDILELNKARARANPFETIRSMFFMNRAALKMANIDAACDFMFTTIEMTENFNEESSPIYFADVCAGPGGFTEYILWRKQWLYKGFGLTLRDEHNFKVSESTCASGVTFQALYGVDGLGDVCNPENLKDVTNRVRNETDGIGVHFMMSDGGFCVEGQENLQEVLSKKIYICQCLLALNILRPHGHFVTKTFDVFTPFSVGLLYLMYLCFEKVTIIKPNSSRPANSERYFVCNNFKIHPQTNIIRDYLWKIAIRLWEIRTLPDRDVLEIIPLEKLRQDQKFFEYIFNSNTNIGKKQIVALKKLAQFCRNPSLVEVRQEILRTQCLEYWKIPDNRRKAPEIYRVENVLNQADLDIGTLILPPIFIESKAGLQSALTDISKWYYSYMYSSRNANRTNFYAGVGLSKAYRLQNNRWVKVKDLELVKGTLLYGEFVKEFSLLENNEISTKYSLHVIDALFLGSMDIRSYTFRERLNFIHIYCKAVNKESQAKYSVRVRPKKLEALTCLPHRLFKNEEAEEGFWITLPKIGYQSTCEKHEVNSLMLLKIDDNSSSFQPIKSSFRVQICNAKDPAITTTISLEDLTKTINKLLS